MARPTFPAMLPTAAAFAALARAAAARRGVDRQPAAAHAHDRGGAGRRRRCRVPSRFPAPASPSSPISSSRISAIGRACKYSELHARRGDDWPRFWLAPAHETPPGGESFAALTRASTRAIARLNERHRGRDIRRRSPMAARSARRWRWRWASRPRPRWRSASTTSRSPGSSISPSRGAAHGWRVAAVNHPPR